MGRTSSAVSSTTWCWIPATAARCWERQAAGLPTRDAWLTIKRQAFDDDGGEPLGLYFGTTSGEIWLSTDEGKRWRCLARHLPEIYSVQAVSLG